MTDRRTVLLIGGPEAGKSNYLFRLWLALRDGRQREIVPDGLPDELDYLNAGLGTQLRGAFAGHTPESVRELIEIPVLANGRPASLVLPDHPGEASLRVYSDRRWPWEWETLVDAGTACLVFIRANSPLNSAPLDWMAVQKAYGSNAANLDDIPGGGMGDVPTQVVVVEWLQMLRDLFRRRAGCGHLPRVGIVISAWDVLSEDDREGGPLAFLRREFGLVADFLDGNADRYEFAAFGVSIYDGDFIGQPTFRTEFLTEGRPKDRGRVVTSGADGSAQTIEDLAFPVAWALGATRMP